MRDIGPTVKLGSCYDRTSTLDGRINASEGMHYDHIAANGIDLGKGMKAYLEQPSAALSDGAGAAFGGDSVRSRSVRGDDDACTSMTSSRTGKKNKKRAA